MRDPIRTELLTSAATVAAVLFLVSLISFAPGT
jgi:hypothetical protein